MRNTPGRKPVIFLFEALEVILLDSRNIRILPKETFSPEVAFRRLHVEQREVWATTVTQPGNSRLKLGQSPIGIPRESSAVLAAELKDLLVSINERINHLTDLLQLRIHRLTG
jgi:hypothetical protein